MTKMTFAFHSSGCSGWLAGAGDELMNFESDKKEQRNKSKRNEKHFTHCKVLAAGLMFAFFSHLPKKRARMLMVI